VVIINIYIYVYTHAHIYIYIYLYIWLFEPQFETYREVLHKLISYYFRIAVLFCALNVLCIGMYVV
jgi:hypothetical protein